MDAHIVPEAEVLAMSVTNDQLENGHLDLERQVRAWLDANKPPPA